jgi:hypothetical protein
VEYSFMMNFPFESPEDTEMTYKLIERLKNDNPQASVWRVNSYTPYPGTKLYDEYCPEIICNTMEEWCTWDWYNTDVDNRMNPRMLY